jgi:hypothetical protein
LSNLPGTRTLRTGAVDCGSWLGFAISPPPLSDLSGRRGCQGSFSFQFFHGCGAMKTETEALTPLSCGGLW